MNNMTVREFLKSYVSRYAAIRIMHYFQETDGPSEVLSEVLYEGSAKLDKIPDDVGRRIVSSIVAATNVLYIAVYKEDDKSRKTENLSGDIQGTERKSGGESSARTVGDMARRGGVHVPRTGKE